MREDAVLGENCIVGRGAYIGTGVVMGDNCKVQNYALVYEPAHLGDGVFIGPAVVLTNDTYPRAINPDGTLKSAHDWEPVGVTIERGASIGARADVRRSRDDRRVGDGRRRRRRRQGRARLTPSSPASPPAASAGSGERACPSSSSDGRTGSAPRRATRYRRDRRISSREAERD